VEYRQLPQADISLAKQYFEIYFSAAILRTRYKVINDVKNVTMNIFLISIKTLGLFIFQNDLLQKELLQKNYFLNN
jgi:hypothetical protein